MPSADAEVYGALARALAPLGVRWYVFGAQAAILYGAARFTEDIDVTVELGNIQTSVLSRLWKNRDLSPGLPERHERLAICRASPTGFERLLNSKNLGKPVHLRVKLVA